MSTSPLTSVSASGLGTAERTAASAEARQTAEAFESVFLSQILSQLNLGFTTPGVGSEGKDSPFASMLRDEYAKIVSRSGGIGVADAVMREILRTQEVA
jgi:Rod binding domain-containing protein